jgi:hypothetical protein
MKHFPIAIQAYIQTTQEKKFLNIWEKLSELENNYTKQSNTEQQNTSNRQLFAVGTVAQMTAKHNRLLVGTVAQMVSSRNNLRVDMRRRVPHNKQVHDKLLKDQ